jgi:YD repeat-containing protein
MSEAWKLPDLCLCASDIFSNLFSIRSHRPLLPIHRPHRVGGVGTVVVGGACRQTCEVADEGQLVSSTDPEGFTTYYGYDNLGRLIYRDHPDAGTTQYEYDPAGNITKETNMPNVNFFSHPS